MTASQDLRELAERVAQGEKLLAVGPPSPPSPPWEIREREDGALWLYTGGERLYVPGREPLAHIARQFAFAQQRLRELEGMAGEMIGADPEQRYGDGGCIEAALKFWFEAHKAERKICDELRARVRELEMVLCSVIEHLDDPQVVQYINDTLDAAEKEVPGE